MAKVQNISTISPNIPFTEYDFYDFYKSTFKQTELGRIYLQRCGLPHYARRKHIQYAMAICRFSVDYVSIVS